MLPLRDIAVRTLCLEPRLFHNLQRPRTVFRFESHSSQLCRGSGSSAGVGSHHRPLDHRLDGDSEVDSSSSSSSYPPHSRYREPQFQKWDSSSDVCFHSCSSPGLERCDQAPRRFDGDSSFAPLWVERWKTEGMKDDDACDDAVGSETHFCDHGLSKVKMLDVVSEKTCVVASSDHVLPRLAQARQWV